MGTISRYDDEPNRFEMTSLVLTSIVYSQIPLLFHHQHEMLKRQSSSYPSNDDQQLVITNPFFIDVEVNPSKFGNDILSFSGQTIKITGSSN